jgi:pimeloyl-ACP methyl ester carboxylesterase
MRALSEERLAPANGIEIAYQEVGDPDGTPLLLVMGLGTQMLAWDERLCVMLADRGYRVVRFDNRDIGHSTKIDEAGMPSRIDMMRGRRDAAPYLLRDMAADAFGLMDHLGLGSAHLVGASMGGMIAQTMAIERPERVESPVSMMSSTGNWWLGWPHWRALGVLFADYPKSRDAYVKRVLRTFDIVGSPGYHPDHEHLAEIAGQMYDRSRNPAGILRQMYAVTASGDRTKALKRLRLPVTVIHGTADRLVRPSAGKATARAIPGARLRMIDGMGHDLPRELWPTFVEEIEETTARASSPESASTAA